MMKKEYQAPKMKVVELKHQASLLDASDAPCDAEYCDELGFNIDKSVNTKA